MALLFMDSFDHYTTFSHKWSQVSSSSFGSGRYGSGLTCPNGGWGLSIGKSVSTASSTCIIGFAWYINSFGSDSQASGVLNVVNTGSALDASVQFQIRIDALTGANLRLMRGDGAATMVGGPTLALGTWNYIEAKVVLHDTAGTAELRVNEQSYGVFTGNTRGQANNGFNGFSFGGSSSNNHSISSQYDDVYICDGTGSTNNTFLGDCRVQALFPDGNSAVANDWVGSDSNSTDNYLLVDETNPATADYTQTSTQNAKDLYTYQNSSAVGTIYAVQVLPYAAKTDTGVRTIASIANLAGTEKVGTSNNLSTSAIYYPEVMETDPNDAQWTISNVNNTEFGIELIA
jgi:hypothetical protein